MYYPSNQKPYRNKAPRIMTVIGTANLLCRPDTVRIHLEVMTENELLSQAQQENAAKMNQVIQALLQTGFPKDNIQTASYNIFPKYDYMEGKQVFRGYQVSNAIMVKIINVTQAGKIIDLAVNNGVNHVSNIQFSLENQQVYYQETLSNALRNALAKAKTISETLNIDFDTIPLKITEEISELPHPLQKFATGTSTPIEPGEIEIHALVKVQFRYNI
ncbi:SIMPL domain-containing protein [Bacillus sp. FJAT-49736]|uniref:SIMPL domain-containing protein n=1 Tax=Bacillus sp. FJAT-49736 TaxID=2833582 RepID=UPI001BC9E899|nr:SIMPL domain-containing protein [Bacillus sp. FJAT-49736]MBS4174822.1 SIMPL domain-containing protein [Bacillus sp. FJAT-49736]MBS4175521.1 SIMPL domain-containing protein [Bacillus sp. FJAT-49736]